MEKRIGTLLILIKDRSAIHTINNIISHFSEFIIGRQGIPQFEKDLNVISLIIHADTDQIGALTGKLGKIEGVAVKSAVIKLESLS